MQRRHRQIMLPARASKPQDDPIQRPSGLHDPLRRTFGATARKYAFRLLCRLAGRRVDHLFNHALGLAG